MKNTKTSGALAVAAALAALSVFLGWKLHEAAATQRAQQDEVRTLRKAVARADKAKDAALAKLQAQARQAEQTLQARARAIKGDQPYENALEAWIGRVSRLRAYLARYPGYRIPEMATLTAADWLDATKEDKLETEADFRKALAHLREQARQTDMRVVGQALKKALAANGGKLPADLATIAAYLPPGADPAIIQRLQVNESGKIPGLRELGPSPMRFVLVEAPVDPLWDYTTFYSENGGGGMRRSGPGGIERQVQDAINAYTKATNAAPTDVSQINPYLGIAVKDQATVDAVFQAMTTKPNL